MRHFVQYHSCEKMGGPPLERFRVYTNKPAPKEIDGDRVWLILGQRMGPKCTRYSLHSTFIAERVEPAAHACFAWQISGSDGTTFDPPILLEDEYWLPDLRARVGNFGFGLTDVTPSLLIVGGLRTVGGC